MERGRWEFLPTHYSTKHPSIHMPRWASRITLAQTEVRLQKLQEITEEDAKAEGVLSFFAQLSELGLDQCITSGEYARDSEHRAAFAVLWDSIYAEVSPWIDNGWVFASTFR